MFNLSILFILNFLVGIINCNTIENYLFSANINNNKIILNKHFSDCRPIIISYENIFEDNTNNKKQIIFNEISNDVFDIYNSVISTMNTTNVYFETKHKMTYCISNSYSNALHVSFYMKDFKFQDMKNNIILSLSFNSPINYDGKNILEIKDYILTFSDKVISDKKVKNVQIERFGNYFYLHFPSYNDDMYYNFIINYDNYNI